MKKILFILSVIFLVAPALTQAAGIIIPLYTNTPNDTYWDQVIAAKGNTNVTTFIIANGPGPYGVGGAPTIGDPGYTTGISKMHAAGIGVLGYVDEAGGSGDIYAAIDAWSTFGVDGIFFDQWYTVNPDIVSYAKSKTAFVVANMGANMGSQFLISGIDAICAFEQGSLPELNYMYTLSSLYGIALYILPYDQPTLDTNWLTNVALPNTAWLYVTNDTLNPSPWDTVPPYLGQLFQAVSGSGDPVCSSLFCFLCSEGECDSTDGCQWQLDANGVGQCAPEGSVTCNPPCPNSLSYPCTAIIDPWPGCEDQAPAGGCARGIFCPPGYSCTETGCVSSGSGTCATSADCPSGQICVSGKCVNQYTYVPPDNPTDDVEGCSVPCQDRNLFDCGQPVEAKTGCTCNETGTKCPSGESCKNGTCQPGIQLLGPLNASSSGSLIDNVINFFFAAGVVLAPLFYLIAGGYLIMAAGDPIKVATAKRIFLYTTIGLGIVLLARALIYVVQSVVGG